ncbi:MAG TPA: hypothetical protein VKU85_00025, partial [bacterium]|nr:hypothetical protein [bacterium]
MRALIAVIPALALAVSPAHADKDPGPRYAGEVADLVRLEVAKYNDLTELPLPDLDDDQVDDLLRGEVVRLRWKQPVPGAEAEAEDGEDPKERHRVVAVYLIQKPMQDVWLAAMDPHTKASDKVTEFRIGPEADGRDPRWYQFMDLPWPVENRHWAIDIHRNRELATATGNRIWEASWSLVPEGRDLALRMAKAGETKPISRGDIESAVYLEANVGAWAMFALSSDLTLLTYQVTVVLGGLLPEGLTARFAMSELEDLCHTIADTAADYPEHYDAEHDPISGGD